ncbi:MAG: tetratricopeptide repeat protein [Defluviicoccus sp.]|nr:tetratricopeptide repeat protein [Defluviicoccus sp.]
MTICTGQWKPALMGCAILTLSLWSGIASSSDAIRRALSLIDQQRYSQAREVLELEPNTPRLRLVRGVLHAREGNRSRAIEIFEQLRSDHPEVVEAYNNLAVLYADQGRLEAARGVLVSALERTSDAILYANLGDVYMRLADRAYVRARKLSAVDPGTAARVWEGASSSAVAGGAPTPLLATGLKGDRGERVETTRQAEENGAKRPAFAASADGQCLRAERFKDRRAGTEAAEWLQLRGAEVLEIRREERQVDQSYWVRLSTPGGPGSARKTMRDLRRLGVRDVAAVAGSERPGTISLGVYRSKSNMQRRVAELEKLGYKAMSGANSKVLREYVVRARSPGDRAALKDAWAKRFPDNPMRRVRCSGPK